VTCKCQAQHEEVLCATQCSLILHKPMCKGHMRMLGTQYCAKGQKGRCLYDLNSLARACSWLWWERQMWASPHWCRSCLQGSQRSATTLSPPAASRWVTSMLIHSAIRYAQSLSRRTGVPVIQSCPNQSALCTSSIYCRGLGLCEWRGIGLTILFTLVPHLWIRMGRKISCIGESLI